MYRKPKYAIARMEKMSNTARIDTIDKILCKKYREKNFSFLKIQIEVGFSFSFCIFTRVNNKNNIEA
jgi:hypothetical protein